MHRSCTRCERPFSPKDLARDESRNMESERKAAGLTGVRFLYYHCPDCSMNDIFVDILPLPGETREDFESRLSQMEDIARGLHGVEAEAVVNTVPAH